MTPAAAQETFRRFRQLTLEGRYAEAWPLFEARRWHPGFRGLVPTPRAAYPEWTGEDVVGRKVMVVVEQGLGDQLMFGRYLQPLAERGAEVEVLCNPFYLARLFETLGHVARPFFPQAPAPSADYWVLIGSLPWRLGLGAPPPPRYLDLPITIGGGIGVVTIGSPLHANDAARSLPPELGARLLTLGRDLLPSATGALDFLDSARIVAGLDLVITVDTAMAHLAGALGKPCWTLLPFQRLDWRWGDGRRSDWYPDMRLIRQPAPGDWGSVVDLVVREVAGRPP